nr:MAG TPA: hypothetical protein [Caudoviricetes sp.]
MNLLREGARSDLRGLIHRDGSHLLPRLDDVARARDEEPSAYESVAAGRASHGERVGHPTASGLVAGHDAYKGDDGPRVPGIERGVVGAAGVAAADHASSVCAHTCPMQARRGPIPPLLGDLRLLIDRVFRCSRRDR